MKQSLTLDDLEAVALNEFVRIVEALPVFPQPVVAADKIHRLPEGTIVVPVAIQGAKPSLSLALLVGHKAEHLYKQTTCRFILAQCPEKDPQHRVYLWTGEGWQTPP
jgi:hypothetical protein